LPPAALSGRDVEIFVADDEESAAQIVAERLSDAARAGRQLALTGGSTPRRAYELSASLEPDWSRAGVWWGDERCVPPDDERSNFRLADESLLQRLAKPPAEVHRIRGELGPDAAASAYEDELRAARPDFVLLGLGPDGHVASLFPDAPTLDERERLAVPAKPQLEPYVDRVTLTLPVLCADDVVFFVTGAGKAEAAARAFAGPPDRNVPGSLVRARSGTTVAVLDGAAAARLSD
jgi:6-phosphogluconolactonase